MFLINDKNKSFIFSWVKKIIPIVLFVSIFISPLSIHIATNTSDFQSDKVVTLKIIHANDHGKPKNAQISKCALGLTGIDYDIVQCVVVPLMNKTLGTAAWILWGTGVFLDEAVNFTLNIKDYAKNTGAVNLAWTAFRDLANMFFIFILLYIAIATILQLNNFDTKRFLTRLIVIALLINFSLFFTNIVIDISNVLAESFYSGIVGSDPDVGISARFMQGLQLQSFYNNSDGTADIQLSAETVFSAGLLGSLFMLITAFTFLAAAIMFVIRTAVLIILMVLSPIAFAGHILPKTQGYSQEWWSTLFAQSFFAPVYLIMVWVVMKVIEGGVAIKGGGEINFATLITSSDRVAPVVFSYAILITLIMTALVVAKKISTSGSTTLTNAAGKTLGAVAGGVGGWAGRNTLGRGFNALAGSQRMKEWGANNRFFVSNMLTRGTRGLASSSWDIRGARAISKVGEGAGIEFGKAGGKGGYEAQLKTQVKSREEFGKYIGEGEGGLERQKAYAETLKSRSIDTLWTKVARKDKEAATKIEKDLNKKEEKETRKKRKESAAPEIKDLNQELAKLRGTLEDVEFDLKKTGISDEVIFGWKEQKNTLRSDIAAKESRLQEINSGLQTDREEERDAEIAELASKTKGLMKKSEGGGDKSTENKKEEKA